jgi:hypothetical protein
MHVTLLGCPLPVGGANVEAGHTALLWRQSGIEVTIVPTWSIDPDNPWSERLRTAGCRIVESSPDNLQAVPGLAGGIVVSFANHHVCEAWDALQSLGCKVVWSPCMTYWQPHERLAFRKAMPAAVHFQSLFQHSQLAPWLLEHGCLDDRHWLIHSALDISQFPYRPAKLGSTFRIGRLARPDRLKWNRSMFGIVAAVRERNVPAEPLMMGWNRATENKCGVAPPWAKGFAPDCMTSHHFLSDCHALLCLNGGEQENWPRVGLEAMASGVPIVAEARWGWLEMIRHGATGLLCDTPADFANALTRLANDEPLRLSLAANARKAVEELTDPGTLLPAWRALFNSLGANPVLPMMEL